MPRLAVTIIARDEEDRLPAVLASVRFADEIVVVVDAATKDRTEEIARAAGAHTLVRVFDGFGPQKNAAADLTTAPWILSLDADEAVSPALAKEIESLFTRLSEMPARGETVGYRIPIRLHFLGRTLRFGRDTVVKPVRLYHRAFARFTNAPIHERVVPDGPVEVLHGSVLHRSYRDLAHYLEKLDLYTTLAAEARFEARRRATRLLPLRVGWELFDRAVLRLGILDGREGLTWAMLSTGNTLLKNLKLRELWRKAGARS